MPIYRRKEDTYGKVETEGDLIKVDNNESRNNNEEYKSVCQDCWYERK